MYKEILEKSFIYITVNVNTKDVEARTVQRLLNVNVMLNLLVLNSCLFVNYILIVIQFSQFKKYKNIYSTNCSK